MQAICGVHFGWANEPIEITFAPVSPNASSSRSLASTGILALSICRPSRMVSSLMVTDFGKLLMGASLKLLIALVAFARDLGLGQHYPPNPANVTVVSTSERRLSGLRIGLVWRQS